MDNARVDRKEDSAVQPFFTVGQGNNEENRNNFEAENNLDTSNEATAWDGEAPDRQPGAVGDVAIGLYENEEKGASGQELGRVVNMEMPPGMEGVSKGESADRDVLSDIGGDNNIEISKREMPVIARTQQDVKEYMSGKMSPADVVSRIHEDSDNYLMVEFKRILGQ